MELNNSLTSSFRYNWTQAVAESPPIFLNVTFGIPLALVAIVETVVEVVKMIFRGIGALPSLIRDNLQKHPLEKESKSRSKNFNLQKVFYFGKIALGIALTTYVSYLAISYLNANFPTSFGFFKASQAAGLSNNVENQVPVVSTSFTFLRDLLPTKITNFSSSTNLNEIKTDVNNSSPLHAIGSLFNIFGNQPGKEAEKITLADFNTVGPSPYGEMAYPNEQSFSSPISGKTAFIGATSIVLMGMGIYYYLIKRVNVIGMNPV